MITPRQRVMLYLRTPVRWDELQAALASALGLGTDQVRDLDEEVDPAVRVQTRDASAGFRCTLDLYLDPVRVLVPPRDRLAAALARQLAVDVAHHDGSSLPFRCVIARADGHRFATDESGDEGDGLMLVEDPEFLKALPPIA